MGHDSSSPKGAYKTDGTSSNCIKRTPRRATSAEKDNVANLSREDRERFLLDPVATEAMAGRGTVYAWLKGTKPVPRRQGVRPKSKRGPNGPQESQVENNENDSECSEADSPEHNVNAMEMSIPDPDGNSLPPSAYQSLQTHRHLKLMVNSVSDIP
ncbi:hypothetical protein PVAR5_2755 [Paecilomyces variotii No. 5]|uniref:Uncharacterized protein n=1 Tax=Byssochlamys spectabilis (strain No. 5 / NBRC 109023) TaxID=1356009 RepID=V5FBN8_BYSSN|nr:hypothetical protein PVAR5_2755 [Paecilomyces variotii No. 5]